VNVIDTGLPNAGYVKSTDSTPVSIPAQHEKPEHSPFLGQIKTFSPAFHALHFAHFWIVC
jgi:hypothetical protein